jgi:DDE superfamily endonuclease
MPICNTAAMNHHLCEISSQVAADAHAVVILDGASWHKSHGLVAPSNITLLALPPYSPQLNPVERVWHYLRSHWLANYAAPRFSMPPSLTETFGHLANSAMLARHAAWTSSFLPA